MASPKISILVSTRDTNEVFFRDMLESLVAQEYSQWELWVMNEEQFAPVSRAVSEFFPNDPRVHYKKIHDKKGEAYGINIGFHFMNADYALILHQHTRLAPNALMEIAAAIEEHPELDIIYTDHDEIEDEIRTNPHFKTDLNVELLRHKNYIGNNFVASRNAIYKCGKMREELTVAACYDFLLRACELKLNFGHIPKLSFHCHNIPETLLPGKVSRFDFPWETKERKEAKRQFRKGYREYMTVCQAHLKRLGIEGTVKEATGYHHWDIVYDGSGFNNRKKDYIMLSDENVRVFQRNAKEIMYGYLKQKDVAVVGVRFLSSGFTIDNCGFIYDESGVYPQFYGTRLSEMTYENLGNLPRDVSAIDFGYCMIDGAAYKHLGLDTSLTGRDLMLDFCLRAKEKGYRTVFVPQVSAVARDKQVVSSEESHNALLNKWGDKLSQDPLYNANFVVGLENYVLSVED